MPPFPLGTVVASFLAVVFSTASLRAQGPILHYTFDTDSGGSTPDAVGTTSATLGRRVQINTSVPDRIGAVLWRCWEVATPRGPATAR